MEQFDEFEDFDSLDDMDEEDSNGKIAQHCNVDDDSCEWDDDYDLESESQFDSLFDERDEYFDEEE